jgi:hypothetical protein
VREDETAIAVDDERLHGATSRRFTLSPRFGLCKPL